ncbi:MAG: DUF167 domain-containing protein [Planctomycetota bacterium]|nr:DUF167 domain-containing protein [Planctomycetota bacterium]
MENKTKIDFREIDGGVVIPVKVVPGSSRDRVVGVLGDCLKIATSVPAEKGRANKAVASILAKALGVSKKDVALISGPTNQRKEFRIAGLSAKQVTSRLEKLG